jgi:hypothetical protein
MQTNFLDVPGEIRNKIYGYVMYYPGAIHLNFKEFVIPCYPDPKPRILYDWWLMRRYYKLRTLDLNLLFVSKVISKDEKSFFFSQNVFSFSWCDGPSTSRIFERIGLDNVSEIEQVLLQFPWTQGEPLPFGDVDSALETLKQVQRYCKSLKTLTTAPYIDQALDYRLQPGENSEDDIRIFWNALMLSLDPFRPFRRLLFG